MKRVLFVWMSVCFGIISNAQNCKELFISEYLEGSSYNKAIEIFNPDLVDKDLSQYALMLFSNGNTTASKTFVLKGTLAAGETYIIAHSRAGDALKLLADSLNDVVNFNGDDAIAIGLYDDIKMTYDTIDVVGRIGEQVKWKVGTGSMDNNTLVRKQTVENGVTQWRKGELQWDVYANDEMSYLKAHSSDCPRTAPHITKVTMLAKSFNWSESSGKNYFIVKADSVEIGQTVKVFFKSNGGTAVVGTDYTIANQVIEFTTTNVRDSFYVDVMDDQTVDGNVFFELKLVIAEGAESGNIVTSIVTIIDDDFPSLTLEEANQDDADGIPIHMNEKVWITGVQNAMFLKASQTYYLQSGNFGIAVEGMATYIPTMGDSIRILGEITHRNGHTFLINPSDLELVQRDRSFEEKEINTPLNEAWESQVVSIMNLKVVDKNQWRESGEFYLDVTDGTETYSVFFNDKINRPRQLVSNKLEVKGIVIQNDKTAPYNSDYHLLLRDYSDLTFITGLDRKEGDFAINVFPNPTKDVFTIQSTRPGTATLWTLSGQKVKTIQYQSGQRQLDISDFEKGIYLLQIQSENGHVLRERIVKN